MSADLYDHDILAWSRAQADRLRRMAAGERVNDLDWANVIEEIESVGKSELSGVESLLLQAFIHALKIVAWPDHLSRRKWRNEIAVFLRGAQRRYEPGMRQALDIGTTYGDAIAAVREQDYGRPPGPLPDTTDLTPAELMDRGFGADALIARLGG